MLQSSVQIVHAAPTKQDGFASLQLQKFVPHPSPSKKQLVTCLVFLRQQGQPLSCDRMVHEELEGA